MTHKFESMYKHRENAKGFSMQDSENVFRPMSHDLPLSISQCPRDM